MMAVFMSLFCFVLGAQAAPNLSDTIPVNKADTLKEVVITGEKIRHDADGYRINVGHYPQLQGMDLGQMMNYLPGMTVNDTDMKVFGNRVGEVYVNNKRVRLSGNELLQYLSTFDGRTIQSIKVIESAGSEVSATSGGMAIIKIYTRKLDDGGSLNISAEANWRPDSHNTRGQMNLQQRSGRWSVSAVGGYEYFHSNLKREWEMHYDESQTSLLEKTDVTVNHHRPTANIGIAYDFSPNDYLTVDAGLFSNRSTGNGRYDVTRQQQPDTEQHVTLSNDKSDDRHYTLSTQYVHNWAKGSLSLSSFWLDMSNNSEMHLQRQDITTQPLLHTANDNHDRLLSANADYQQKLSDKWGTLRAGASVAAWHNSDDAKAWHYRYREHSEAAYLSWDWQRGAFSSSVGLRYEHREVNPKAHDGADNWGSYNNLYPSLRLNYAFSQRHGHNLRVALSRRCVMPMMRQMNPFENWNDEYSYTVGNPMLKPEFSKSANAHLTLWRNYSLTATYTQGGDQRSVMEPMPGSEVVVTTYRNGVRNHGWRLGASAMVPLGKRAIVNININQNFQRWRYADEYVRDNSWSAHAYGSFQLPLGLSYSLNASYTSSQPSLYSTSEGQFGFGTGLRRSFLHDALTLSVSYMFLAKNRHDYHVEGIQQTQRPDIAFHRIGVTASYLLQWGNKRAQVRRNSSYHSEQSRI